MAADRTVVADAGDRLAGLHGVARGDEHLPHVSVRDPHVRQLSVAGEPADPPDDNPTLHNVRPPLHYRGNISVANIARTTADHP